ncbi:MAG TPA: ACT domain-containing protein [Bacteroidales bacterium]|nr:ACT domain-containing protein [Bacteroidales bacterium]
MDLKVLPAIYTVYRFETHAELPSWIYDSEFYSVTMTGDEISVVTLHHDSVPPGVRYEEGWRIIRICGQLDFSLVGIISEISGILKESRIPVFVISSFDTDYIMVKSARLGNAIDALSGQGHKFLSDLPGH